jgi:hypothetical protein
MTIENRAKRANIPLFFKLLRLRPKRGIKRKGTRGARSLELYASNLPILPITKKRPAVIIRTTIVSALYFFQNFGRDKNDIMANGVVKKNPQGAKSIEKRFERKVESGNLNP